MNTQQEIPDILSTYTRDPLLERGNQNTMPQRIDAPIHPRNTFEICVDGLIKIVRIVAWLLALFSTLFVVTLATNTFGKAVEILKSPLKIVFPTVDTWEVDENQEMSKMSASKKNDLSSNALNTTTKPATETPEMIAKKRAALVEARKAARLQQEKLNVVENQIR